MIIIKLSKKCLKISTLEFISKIKFKINKKLYASSVFY
jgi:hypothetical protein